MQARGLVIYFARCRFNGIIEAFTIERLFTMWTAAQSPNTPKYIRTEMLKLISQSARVLPQPMTLEFLQGICESLRKPFDKGSATTKAEDQSETAIVDCLLPLLRNMKSDGLITEDTLRLECAPQNMAAELLWRTMWAVNRCNYGFVSGGDDAAADQKALRALASSGLAALNPHLDFVMDMFDEVVEQVDDAVMKSYFTTCIECIRVTSEAPLSSTAMNQSVTSAVAIQRLLDRSMERGKFSEDLSVYFSKDSVVLNWLRQSCSAENKLTSNLAMGVAVRAMFELLSAMHVCQQHLDFNVMKMIWDLTWPCEGIIRDTLYMWLTSTSKTPSITKDDKLLVLRDLLMMSYDAKTLSDVTSVGFECFSEFFCVCNNHNIVMQETKRGDTVIVEVLNVTSLIGHSCLWKLCLHVPESTFVTAMALICKMYTRISAEEVRERFCEFVSTWALESIKTGNDTHVSRVVKVFNTLLGVSLKPEGLDPHCNGDTALTLVNVEMPTQNPPLLFELPLRNDLIFYTLRQIVRKKLRETMNRKTKCNFSFFHGKRRLTGNHLTLRALGIRDGDTIIAKMYRAESTRCVGDGALWRLLSKDGHVFNALLNYLEKSCDSDEIDQEVWNFLMAIPTNEMFQKTFEQSPQDLDWSTLFSSSRIVDGKTESNFFRVVYLLQVLEKHKMNSKVKTADGNLWRSQFLASDGLLIIFDFLMNMDIHRENGQVDPIRRIGLITTLRVINYFMNGSTNDISIGDDEDAAAEKVCVHIAAPIQPSTNFRPRSS